MSLVVRESDGDWRGGSVPTFCHHSSPRLELAPVFGEVDFYRFLPDSLIDCCALYCLLWKTVCVGSGPSSPSNVNTRSSPRTACKTYPRRTKAVGERARTSTVVCSKTIDRQKKTSGCAQVVGVEIRKHNQHRSVEIGLKEKVALALESNPVTKVVVSNESNQRQQNSTSALGSLK